MKKGNRELAIKNYEKSLELNPQNGGARDALHRLRAK
jgi:Tfp pilus assembly protein PilF